MTDVKTVLPLRKLCNGIDWCSALTLGPVHIKLLQPGLEMSSNLTDPYSQGFSQVEKEMANSPNEL